MAHDVMYYAVERDLISQLDGIPTDFGPNTRADLAAILEGWPAGSSAPAPARAGVMTARILVVCTANICRSPMAERLLAEHLVRYALDEHVVVSSAGTHARPGDIAADGMQQVAERWGLDLGYHRSRGVDAQLASPQDLIITMEDRHRSIVSRLAAGLGQRTFSITELAALVDAVGPVPGGLPAAPEGLPAHVARWHAARARTSIHAPDIADPYGGPQDGYNETARQLADLIEQVGPALATAVLGSRPE